MPKPEKIQAVAEMKKLFDDAGSYFITDYQGLNVADMTELRKNLRENNVRYLIAKNTLMKIAAKDAGVPDTVIGELKGPTAIAFTSEDAAPAAKILHDSYKKKELPRVKVFVVEDDIYNGEDLKRLADLPSRDILLSMVVASVEAPFTSLIGSIDGFFRKLVGTVDALAEKKKSEE